MNKKASFLNHLFSINTSIIKKYHLHGLLLLFMPIISTHSANALDLSVPIGATGYLGEVTPPVSMANLDFAMFESKLYANSPIIRFIWEDDNVTWQMPFYPEIGRGGIKLVNKSNPKGAFIVLAPSGFFTMRYKRANGTFDTVSAVFNRSQTVSMTGLYNNNWANTRFNEYNWGILPRQGASNFFAYSQKEKFNVFSITITSYSAYAIGPLEPGEYTMSERSKFSVYISISSGFNAVAKPPLLTPADTVHINALKACDVIPQSNTNIQFPNQLAKNYTTPTKLAESIASISVNCPYDNKNVHLTLSPFNNLVSGSHTGMELSASKAENITTLPYVVASLKSTTSSICQANAQEALQLVGSNKLTSQNMQSFIQNINFNLCANGNIKSDKYTGAINVAVLIE